MPVRIELHDPELADDLVGFLANAGYVADAVAGGVVEARLPSAPEAFGSLDLWLALRSWCGRTGAIATLLSGPRLRY